MKINNVHISTLQGHLLDGSLASLLSYPALKTPKKNDWAEAHFSQYDLTNLHLKSQEINLKILLPQSQWEAFNDLILADLYADYHFSMIDKTYRLRFVGFSKTEYFANQIIAELKLFNDEPMSGYTYQAPSLTAYDTGASLNAKKLSDYGICLLQGSKQEFISKSNVKNTLIIDNAPQNGAVSFARPMVFQEKTATIKCFIYQNTTDFFKGYEAFLHDLTQDGGSVISFENVNYPCLYKDSKITDFFIENNHIWCEFDLSFIFV